MVDGLLLEEVPLADAVVLRLAVLLRLEEALLVGVLELVCSEERLAVDDSIEDCVTVASGDAEDAE